QLCNGLGRPSAAALLSTSDATSTATEPGGKRLPRRQPWRRRPADLRGRRRPPQVRVAAERGFQPVRLAGDRLVPDGDALSPRRGMRPGTAVARGAPTELPVRHVLQPPPQASRAPLREPILLVDRVRRGAPRGDRRLRPRESRPRRTLPPGLRLELELAEAPGRVRRRVATLEGQSLRDCPSSVRRGLVDLGVDPLLRGLQRAALAAGPDRED